MYNRVIIITSQSQGCRVKIKPKYIKREASPQGKVCDWPQKTFEEVIDTKEERDIGQTEKEREREGKCCKRIEELGEYINRYSKHILGHRSGRD